MSMSSSQLSYAGIAMVHLLSAIKLKSSVSAGLVDPLLARGEFSDLTHTGPSDWLSAQDNVTFTSLFGDVTFALHFALKGHSS